MLSRTVLALSTLSLAVSGCETTKRATVALRPDIDHPQWFVCEPAGTRPKIAPEYQIDWGKVAAAPDVAHAVEAAKGEVGKLIATIRTREGVVAGYVLDLEGKHFVCVNNIQTQLDFWKGLAPGGSAGVTRKADPIRIVGPVDLPGASSAVLAFRS